MSLKRLYSSITNNNCILFSGAGLSKNSELLDWNELTESLLKDLINIGYSESNVSQYANDQILQLYSYVLGDVELYKKLKLAITQQNVDPSNIHYYLAKMPFRLYITTNWDCLLEEALIKIGKTPTIITIDSDLKKIDSQNIIVVKLHGDINKIDSIVATEKDYINFKSKRKLLWSWFMAKTLEYDFMFVGYSFSDFHIKLLPYFESAKQKPKKFFVVCADQNNTQVSYLKSYNIYPIKIKGENTKKNIEVFFEKTYKETRIEETDNVGILDLLFSENKLFYKEVKKSPQPEQNIIRNQSNMAVFGTPRINKNFRIFSGKKEYYNSLQIDHFERKLHDIWMKMIDRDVRFQVIISLIPESYTKYKTDQILIRLEYFRDLLKNKLWSKNNINFVIKNGTIESKPTIFNQSRMILINHGITPLPSWASAKLILNRDYILNAVKNFDLEFSEIRKQNLDDAENKGISGKSDFMTIRKYLLRNISDLIEYFKKQSS